MLRPSPKKEALKPFLYKLCNYSNMGRTEAQKESVPIIVKEASR